MKVSELTGAALDWAVAEALGGKIPQGTGTLPNQWAWYEKFAPSTNWSHGGPIIEREIVSIDKEEGGKRWAAYAWRSDRDLQKAIGPTPLVAAMRCFVASKLGDDIEVPPELK